MGFLFLESNLVELGFKVINFLFDWTVFIEISQMIEVSVNNVKRGGIKRFSWGL